LVSVTAQIEQVPIGEAVSREYARIRALLERQGTPIGGNDDWIAAQALALDLVLVTDNQAALTRVPGLSVENWLSG
jgi:tRNA(fMet)-specific endonuclease VapC